MINKTRFSLVIISSVLLSACIVKTPTGIENQAGEDNTAPTEQPQSSSLRELLAMGKSQKCEISSSDTDENGVKTETKGTLYFSGNKMAEEVQMTSSQKDSPPNLTMMMVTDGTYMYSWDVSKKTSGMKFKITQPTEGDKIENKNGSVDLDKKFDMKCTNWTVDNSKFTIPADVKFTDLSEMMENIPTVPANIPTGY